MEKTYDLWEAFEIPHILKLQQASFELGTHLLPRQRITKELVVPTLKSQRCKLESSTRLFKGSRGWIDRVERIPSVECGSLCVKRPHDREYSLVPEALLQYVAYEELEAVGIHGAVPRVVDIYEFAGETRFTMEYIDGISVIDALLTRPNPDQLWKGVLEQVCFLLAVLEARVGLDHRDLKADNLWIRETPVQYCASLGGHPITLIAPFQVVLLDFGFACLGGEDPPTGSSALVSLTDGLVPKIDPCPKPGRDLFYLIATTWSVPGIPGRMGPEMRAWMEEILQGPSRNGLFARLLQTRGANWIYGVVNDVRFRMNGLRPIPLLKEFSKGVGTSVKIEGGEA